MIRLRASLLGYTYIVCLVKFVFISRDRCNGDGYQFSQLFILMSSNAMYRVLCLFRSLLNVTCLVNYLAVLQSTWRAYRI